MKRIIRFERYILIPLDVAFIVLTVLYFFQGDWFGGIIAVIVSLLIGIIGQALHKNKTTVQLLRGEHLIPEEGERSDRISRIESHLLGKAMVYTTIVLTVTTILFGIHSQTAEWWLVATKALGVAILFPILSVFFILFFPKFINSLRGRS